MNIYPYGVTWSTAFKSTTVWFSSRKARAAFIRNLNSNPKVIKQSIKLKDRIENE